MITFLHAADFHLDSPFHSLSPEQAAQRREEQRQLLTRLLNTTKETEADLVFLAGDLFDSQKVRLETMEALYQMLEEMEAEVFISPGNHDPYSELSPYKRLHWPQHVHLFTSPAPQRVEVPDLGCVVYGSAFQSSYRMASPLKGFQAEDEGMVRFGCFHGDLTAPHSRYGPVTHGEIAASGLDYLALGHIHKASGLKKSGETYYAWPGCPEGRGFDETGDKGIYLGQWEDGRISLDFLSLAHRRYMVSKVDITGRDPAAALAECIANAQPEDIVRVILTGEQAPGETLDLVALTALVTPHFYGAGLQDATIMSRELWDRMEEDTLTGLFLRAMHRRIASADEAEQPGLYRAVRFGLAALEGREEPR